MSTFGSGTRHRRHRLAVIAAPLLVVSLAACTSSSDAVDTTSTSAVTTSPATDTPTTSTTSPAGTASPTTTSTSTPATVVATDPPTTIAETTLPSPSPSLPPDDVASTIYAPSPTIYPPDDPRAEVEQAYYSIQQRWVGCLAAMPNCDTSKLGEIYGGRLLGPNKDYVDKFNAGGYSSKGLQDHVDVVLEITIGSDQAQVKRCVFDDSVVSRPDPAGGPDQIGDGEVVSLINRLTMEKGQDGHWRIVDGEPIQKVTGGENLCLG